MLTGAIVPTLMRLALPTIAVFVAQTMVCIALNSYPRTDLAGRELIERMAVESVGTDVSGHRPEHVADVLEFIATNLPKDPQGWWQGSEDEPSIACGFILVLNAVIDSLRGSPMNAPVDEEEALPA